MARSKKKIAAKKKSAPAKKVAPKKKVAAKKPVAKKSAAPKVTAPKKKSVSKKTGAKVGAPSKKAVAKTSAPKSALKKTAVTVKAAVKKIAAKVVATVTHQAPTTDYTQLLTPLDDRVLVRAEPAAERSAGGLYIPGAVNERPHRGLVVAVGRGARNKKGQLRPLDVTVGETVLFAESSGSKLMLAGAELLVLRESDLLGVVD